MMASRGTWKRVHYDCVLGYVRITIEWAGRGRLPPGAAPARVGTSPASPFAKIMGMGLFACGLYLRGLEPVSQVSVAVVISDEGPLDFDTCRSARTAVRGQIVVNRPSLRGKEASRGLESGAIR